METLIIFVKYPQAGKVKTRLAKDIGNDEAAKIYSNMAQSIVENTMAVDNYKTIIFYDPPDKKTEIREWLGKKDLEFKPQLGNTLGDRITNAFDEVYSLGRGKVVIIGSDCLDVSRDTIIKTIELLGSFDVVLGPAEDGGYYLLGTNAHRPELFENIDWSTSKVLNQTLENINKIGLTYKLLKTFKDIDTVDDLEGVGK
ncbi:MAG: TIGR04282 family arsenosugar biosynthesis glycosyltransferase [Thermodesulfobacteriota bacterium]